MILPYRVSVPGNAYSRPVVAPTPGALAAWAAPLPFDTDVVLAAALHRFGGGALIAGAFEVAFGSLDLVPGAEAEAYAEGIEQVFVFVRLPVAADALTPPEGWVAPVVSPYAGDGAQRGYGAFVLTAPEGAAGLTISIACAAPILRLAATLRVVAIE